MPRPGERVARALGRAAACYGRLLALAWPDPHTFTRPAAAAHEPSDGTAYTRSRFVSFLVDSGQPTFYHNPVIPMTLRKACPDAAFRAILHAQKF